MTLGGLVGRNGADTRVGRAPSVNTRIAVCVLDAYLPVSVYGPMRPVFRIGLQLYARMCSHVCARLNHFRLTSGNATPPIARYAIRSVFFGVGSHNAAFNSAVHMWDANVYA